MANELNDEQFKAFGDLIHQSVFDALDEKQMVTRKDIKHLPTKNEFFTETAKIYQLKQKTTSMSSWMNDLNKSQLSCEAEKKPRA